jgi:hypothetical protein
VTSSTAFLDHSLALSRDFFAPAGKPSLSLSSAGRLSVMCFTSSGPDSVTLGLSPVRELYPVKTLYPCCANAPALTPAPFPNPKATAHCLRAPFFLLQKPPIAPLNLRGSIGLGGGVPFCDELGGLSIFYIIYILYNKIRLKTIR